MFVNSLTSTRCTLKHSVLIKSIRALTVYINREMATRLFEDNEHASVYAQYRPTYPDTVYKTIIDYCKSGHGDAGTSSGFDLAVDVGCGSGQSTLPLCKYFKKVIGYDVSSQQIACAPKDVENLSFNVGPGEDLSFLDDNSVDLITIAQALHWLNLDAFYTEVRRVVKPGGVFAAYGYGTCFFSNKNAQDLFLEFYRDVIGPYWDSKRRHVEDEYSNLTYPFKSWNRVEDKDLMIHRSMPVEAFVGYLSSMSAWRGYLKDHQQSDALVQLRKKFDDICKGKNLDVYWKVFMMIGKKDS